jgi:nascent polypeptide-associated complex subunit beta
MNPIKLAQLQKDAMSVRTGGKGSVRRKVKKVSRSAQTDDKKLTATLKKLNVQPLQAVEEVTFFKVSGGVLHFVLPKGTSTLTK